MEAQIRAGDRDRSVICGTETRAEGAMEEREGVKKESSF